MTETDTIDAVLDRHRRDGTRLVQILREIQEQLNWLSPATLTRVAEGIGWPRAMVSGTASFYSFFHTRPRGKYCVLWSDNITYRMLGNAELAGTRSRFRRRPGQREHHLLHRHVRPGSGAAGELPRRDGHDHGQAG